MAGDTIQINATGVYTSTAANTSVTTPPDMISAILNAFSGSGISDGVHGAFGVGSAISTGLTTSVFNSLKQIDTSQNLSTKPKAYLNFALFDDQFALVNDNSGVRQIQGSPNVLQLLSVPRMVIKKTGFLYIYTNNESGSDVFFDNLVVVHNGGPVLEETHFYPFGLAMAGISNHALKGLNYPENKKGYNGNELQSKEFGDASGLELYDFNARTYDQQIGRFIQIDPLIEFGNQEMLTPYQFSYNNPVRYTDPDGKCPLCVVIEIAEVAWDIYTAYKIGKTAVVAVSVVQAGAINGFQPGNGMNTPVPKDNTTVVKDVPIAKVQGSVTDLPFPVPGVLLAKGKDNKTEAEQHGGGKNAQHANQKAREVAQERYETAKKEYEKLKSKPNKTKEDKALVDKAKTTVDHEKRRMDYTGENHNNKAKGSN
jgi:RHS repeat-associated protein